MLSEMCLYINLISYDNKWLPSQNVKQFKCNIIINASNHIFFLNSEALKNIRNSISESLKRKGKNKQDQQTLHPL